MRDYRKLNQGNRTLEKHKGYGTRRISIKSSGTVPGLCTVSSDAGNVLDFNYDFHHSSGDNGNVFKVTNNRNNDRSINYTYDTLNRITAAYTDGNIWGETYTIDPWGNFYLNGSYSSKPQPDTLNQTPTTMNRFSSLSYDAAGNLENDGSNSYTYDAENRISMVGSSLTYYYDGDGKRVRKSSGTLYWHGLGSDPLLETDASGNLTNEYIFFGGKRIARRDSSGNVDYYFAAVVSQR